MNLSPQKLAEVRRVAKTIREILRDDDDEEALIDTLDGETDFTDLVGAILTAEAETQMMAQANERLSDLYRERAAMLDNRINRLRGQFLPLLEAAGVKTVTHALGTVTIAKGRDRVVISDEGALPRLMLSVKTTTAPNKRMILAALENGEEVPGASLSNSGPQVRIRR